MNKHKIVNENPFYGARSLFAMYNGKLNLNNNLLNAAWQEAKDNNKYKELFHLINFEGGSINRQHNIFKKATDIDSGGNSSNASWIVYQKWLLENDIDTFVKLLPLSIEFTNLRDFTHAQVRTHNKSKRVLSVWGLLPDIIKNKKAYSALLNILTTYATHHNDFYKWLIAKNVHIPRYSKRQKRNKENELVGRRDLQKETIEKQGLYFKLLSDLSKLMNWEVINHPNNVQFKGYIQWRKKYNETLEYVLFSSKNILKFDKTEFFEFLNKLPAGGRYRVKNRLYSEKWGDLKEWYNEWVQHKEDAQSKKRELEEKSKTTVLSYDEQIELAKAKKDGKVTLGAKTLFDYVEEYASGKQDDITLDAILDRTKMEVPVLNVIDVSGSMSGKPSLIATLFATISLLKNPDDLYNLFFTFETTTKCITDASIGVNKINRFMQGNDIKVEQLIDRTKPFSWNYNNIRKFTGATGGSTNITGLYDSVKAWINAGDNVEKNHRIEQLLKYQVISILTDGDLNNSHSAAASLQDFQMKMLQDFGWNGVIVLWEIPKWGNINKSGYFDNIENVIHITTYDLSTINQIFTKIHDLDVIDIYTSLKSLYQNNRYDLVKKYLNYE